MMAFNNWTGAATAPQTPLSFGVAPTLFFFAPKALWVVCYQWGRHKFSYRTSKTDPSNSSGWSAEQSLYDTAIPNGGTGPIDQTVICDAGTCFLYYAGDNGHIYVSSMPIGSFPGTFSAAQDSGIQGTTNTLFEAVEVYTYGPSQYLMIVEAMGVHRYFRAWTATALGGPWKLLTDNFAIKSQVSNADWTDDISHGDLIRSNPDQTQTIDTCHLQFLIQGRDPESSPPGGDYGKLPYRIGLLTLK
jgi:hypothetical protein